MTANESTMRHVRLELGYTLRTWDTGKLSGGRTCVGYELCDARGNAILRGSDFRPSPLHADDSDATLRALCGFLFLRSGDTDAEYFDSYSAAQRAFAESSDCEMLAYLYGDEGPGTFAPAEGDR